MIDIKSIRERLENVYKLEQVLMVGDYHSPFTGPNVSDLAACHNKFMLSAPTDIKNLLDALEKCKGILIAAHNYIQQDEYNNFEEGLFEIIKEVFGE